MKISLSQKKIGKSREAPVGMTRHVIALRKLADVRVN